MGQEGNHHAPENVEASDMMEQLTIGEYAECFVHYFNPEFPIFLTSDSIPSITNGLDILPIYRAFVCLNRI